MTVEQYKFKKDKFDEKAREFLDKLIIGELTMENVKQYLIMNDIDVKQAETMIQQLERQYPRKREDYLNNRLHDVMEVLQMPSKWGLTVDNCIVEIFPIPVLDAKYNIKNVKYEPTYSVHYPFVMPKELKARQEEIKNR